MNKGKTTLFLTYSALCTALISVCAWITVPFPTLPVTLQSFAVCTAAAVLGAKMGTVSACLYVAIGALGLPVFSGFTGGVGALMSAGGGFIIGFVPAALVVGLLSDKWGYSFGKTVVAATAGHLVCYMCGTLWFCLVYARDTSLPAALVTCVVPYIIPDILKIITSALVSSRVKKKIKV